MSYAAVKTIHVAAVAVSFALFFVRGVWMMLDSARLERRWVRVAPHVNDTVLLSAGIALAFMLGAWSPWLIAKLVALPIYIALGMLALRPGRTKQVRVAAWVAALLVFGYIVAAAVTQSASL